MKYFFDLDNTLLDLVSSQPKYLSDFYQNFHLFARLDLEEFSNRWKDSLESFYREYLNGQISFREQRTRRFMFALGNNDVSEEVLDQMLKTYDLLLEESWILFDGWIEYFEGSATEKHIITNGSSEQQRRKLGKLKIRKYFETVFISEEVGLAKPDVKFFEHFLAQTKTSTSDAIVVGDSYDNDILPCTCLGIKCIWINHKNEFQHPNPIVSEVSSTSEAIELLRNFT